MVAVMVILVMSLVLFGVAALAVDLGNAFTRKRDVQSQADFSTLAGGAGLPALASTPTAADPAIQNAAEYLFKNQRQNDDGAVPLTKVQLAIVLTDGNPDNGAAYYGHLDAAGNLVPSRGELTIKTPPVLVKYGFAAVLGSANVKVKASATVGLRSPGGGAMPFYAVQGGGCDYGPQTLSDPANGHAQSVVPVMAYPTDTNKSRLDNLSPPAQVGYNTLPSVQQKITINGTGLSGVTQVGFFRSTSLVPNFVMTLPFANSDSTGKTVKDIVVPVEVTSVEDVWWVRVWGPKNGNQGNAWSAASEALPMRVGDSLLECPGVSSAGNFGALMLPRSSNKSGWLAENIATGPEAPLTLAAFPAPAPVNCSPGVAPAVYSTTTGSPTRLAGTNCVDTDTGLTANATTAGLITGAQARLAKPTTTGCSPTRTSASRTVPVAGGKSINDDTLSCFLTTNATIGSIASPTYSGSVALSPAVYSSPRFLWVPVLGIKPTSGGSAHYSIVDYRAAFLTSESTASTKVIPQFTDGSASTTANGLTIANNGVTSMQVVFFNVKALPADAGNATVGAYFGVGPKIVALTN